MCMSKLLTTSVSFLLSTCLFAINPSRPEISENSTDAEIAQFYASMPQSTFNRKLLYYFNTYDEATHARFTEDKEIDDLVSKVDLLGKEQAFTKANSKEFNQLNEKKIKYLSQVLNLNVQSLKEMLLSRHVNLTRNPSLLKELGEYRIPSLSRGNYRYLVTSEINITYNPIPEKYRKELPQKLEKLGLTHLLPAHLLLYSTLERCADLLIDFTRNNADSMNELAKQNGDFVINEAQYYSFLGNADLLFKEYTEMLFSGLTAYFSSITPSEMKILEKNQDENKTLINLNFNINTLSKSNSR